MLCEFHKLLNKKNNYNFSDFNFIKEFKKDKLENRISASNKIIDKFYNRVPIIVDSKIILDKNKFIVPRDMIIAQFMYILRKKLDVNPGEAIFLLCRNNIVMTSDSINTIYERYKEEDGFLYLIITKENTFGNYIR